MAKRSQSELSAAQMQIMNIVWERGEAGVAQIWEELARSRPVARNTVQTMLSRLQTKGWLKHRQEGNAFYYTAAQPRQRVIGRIVSRLIESAFGGSASGLVLTLLQESKLTPEETERIREMIDRAEAKQSKRQKREEA